MSGKTENSYSDFTETKETSSKENPGYRAHPAIANSDLKYLYDPELFQLKKQQKLRPEPETSYQQTGTLVDEYLLNAEEFNEKFILQPDFESTPTSKNQKNFVEDILLYDQVDSEIITEVHNTHYSRSNEDLADELYNELFDYIQFQRKKEGKTPYSQDDYDELKTITKNCASHKLVNRFLFEPKKGDKVFKHLQIIGKEFWGIEWKGELDLAVVNFLDKEIYNIDLKTTSKSLANFGYYYYKRYNYKRQQALYRKLLRAYLVDEGIIDESEANEWVVKTRCIAIESTPLYRVGCIPVPNRVLQDGEAELIEAAEKIKFHRKHGWKRTFSYIKNDGLEVIDWDEFRDS